MKKNSLQDVHDFGQSIWLDYFDRQIMDSGKLKTLIEEYGVTGITSNPSIFEKAINNSSDYDEDIAVISHQKNNSDDIFYSLAIKDIKRAADYFIPAFLKSNGEDGFVSIEVSPHLAYDTEGTIKQARQLWKAIDRRNVMIKIPATAEGLPAIRKCVSEGININITLLFGLPRYEEVIDAYLAGLEDRVKANKPIDQIVSVASFFLSRIDVIIDPVLEEKKLIKLKGEVAIASAKKAYAIYKAVFTGDRFKYLENNGAKRQHLLWASTSSKDPSFSDVKYVEALVGKETINTITIETLEAFRDHGWADDILEEGFDHAYDVMAKLKENGIDIDTITKKLEDEGIEKFDKAYDALMNSIEKKKGKVLA
jgi:transaldolase/transaldolase/glucose-6-phosphate isomerase